MSDSVSKGHRSEKRVFDQGVGVLMWLRHLIRCADGEEVSGVKILANRFILLYFNSMRCPPGRELTPILAHSYRQVRNHYGANSLEVVLVPLDATEDEWRAHMKGMPWLSVPQPYREAVVRLFLHFSIEEMPRLIVIDKDSEVICSNARGGQGFGFGCDPIKAYQHLIELHDERTLAKQGIKKPTIKTDADDSKREADDDDDDDAENA